MEVDLRLRGLDMTSGASAGPLLCRFLSIVASTSCDCLSSLVSGLRVEERRERGTFAIPVWSLFFVFFRGVGAGSWSLDDFPEEVDAAVGGSEEEGPWEDSGFSSSAPSSLSAPAFCSVSTRVSSSSSPLVVGVDDHQLSVICAKFRKSIQTKKKLR